MANPMMSNPAFGAGGIGAFPSQAQGSPSLPSQAFGNPMQQAMGGTSSPTTAIGMFNPGGHQMPAQAIANAQGKPFQPGGMFNPMQQAMNPQAGGITLSGDVPRTGMSSISGAFPQTGGGLQTFDPSRLTAMSPSTMYTATSLPRTGMPPQMPQGMMQNAAPQMNPQTLSFLQNLFARR